MIKRRTTTITRTTTLNLKVMKNNVMFVNHGCFNIGKDKQRGKLSEILIGKRIKTHTSRKVDNNYLCPEVHWLLVTSVFKHHTILDSFHVFHKCIYQINQLGSVLSKQ